MRWTDLAFLHWPVRADLLRGLVPKELAIDTYDGQAWLGIVPFRMEGVRLRAAPPVPTAHLFPELNVRTYVRDRQRGGVWFFSLDAASRLAVRGARLVYNLPYYDAAMRMRSMRPLKTEVDGSETIEYHSRRTHAGVPGAEFDGSYTPVSEPYRVVPGTLEHFLVERYRLFTHSVRRGLGYIEIDHEPWPLQKATAVIRTNTMARAAGIDLPLQAPLVHYARSLDVVAWTRQPAEPRS